MRQSPLATAPTWIEEQLEIDRRRSIEAFVKDRTAIGGQQYQVAFYEDLESVNDLFTATNDLLDFGTGAALAEKPARVQIARYLSGPPVSADDLDTLADASIASRKRLDPDLARLAADIICLTMDGARFPWLFAEPLRRPTPEERYAAMRWTAGLQAAQRVQTARRGESSARQESVVEAMLAASGFHKVARRTVSIVGGLDPGEFCRESLVDGIKCDVPVGLRDGRFLFLECKVSNSSTNSVKRLNREVGGKAAAWRRAFGDRAITAAVLAGVYKLRNLADAQAGGVVIFWEHDLDQLAQFVASAG